MKPNNLNDFYEFVQSIPTADSVRARLDQQAAQTPEGELNSLLNDASNYIAALEKKVRRTMLDDVDVVEKLWALDHVLQKESPALAQIARDAASQILKLRRTVEETKV